MGTSVVRALESAASADGIVRGRSGVTSLRIGAATKRNVATALMSTYPHLKLLMAICTPGTPGAAEAVKQAGKVGPVLPIIQISKNAASRACAAR